MFDFQVISSSTVVFVLITVGLSALVLFCRYVLMPKGFCFVKINDNPELTKQVALGQTLLNALTKEGIAIPSPCGGKATCKQCKLRIVEGAEPPVEIDIATFTKKQIKEGFRLSCQCRMLHDISIRVEERYLHVQEYEAEVLSNENVATFIKELKVRIPQDQVFSYKPGSYMEIYIPEYRTNTSGWKETIPSRYTSEWEKYGMWDRVIRFDGKERMKRAYSLGSYPAEKELFLFDVRIATPPLSSGKVSKDIPWGIGSSYLFSLKPGDRIRMAGPYGESFMKDTQQDVYFLIGGAGASFGRSHILDLLLGKKSKRSISLWYGARSLQENIYEKEYTELAKQFPNFSYHLVLSEPTSEDIASGWPKNDPIKTAFLFKAFEKGVLEKIKHPESSLFYVCGPPLHNKSVMKLLDDYGVPRENIVLDDFGS